MSFENSPGEKNGLLSEVLSQLRCGGIWVQVAANIIRPTLWRKDTNSQKLLISFQKRDHSNILADET